MMPSVVFIILGVLASVESLPLPNHRQFSALPGDDHVNTGFSFPPDDDHAIDLTAFEVGDVGPISLGTHANSFRHDEDIGFGAPDILDGFFRREESDAFISPQQDKDFSFPEAHAELFHSSENQDFGLSARGQHVSYDTKEFPTIYYPESDISAANNIAPDYHVKTYPKNYRQVKEYSDVKPLTDAHSIQSDRSKSHQEQKPETLTSSVDDFAVGEQSSNFGHPDTKFSESPKLASNVFESHKGIPRAQDFPKSNEVVILGKNRPRNEKSVPRRAIGIERQFDSSDFIDFDYSSSSGSSDPFEGNYDGDYYAPGDDDSTVHVGNDAAYDYDYSNSQGPDLSSDYSSFSDDFARSVGILPKLPTTKQKN